MIGDVERLVWSEVRSQSIERFRGQTPRAQDEEIILEVFERAPVIVLQAIDEIAVADVKWCWSALAARLMRGSGGRDVSVDVGPSREKLIASAEQFIRNAGLHFDREEELVDELFGDRGRLRMWAGDSVLVERMSALWRQHRPDGERVEAEAVERGETFVRQRAERVERERLTTIEQRLEAAKAKLAGPAQVTT